MIVIDASALIDVLLRKPSAKALEIRILEFGETLHAPHLIDVEIAHVLRRLKLGGAVDARRAENVFADLADMSLIRYPHDVLLPRVWALRDNLTAYDAIYVALAEELRAPLVTRDRRLANAAGIRAKVEVF